jgi:hypothetical protein
LHRLLQRLLQRLRGAAEKTSGVNPSFRTDSQLLISKIATLLTLYRCCRHCPPPFTPPPCIRLPLPALL